MALKFRPVDASVLSCRFVVQLLLESDLMYIWLSKLLLASFTFAAIEGVVSTLACWVPEAIFDAPPSIWCSKLFSIVELKLLV